ncbi:histidinol-phosphatase HisJ [Fictibacillus phosphorivorans]|uniref:histidinol-phosphatase HisJ n=1 Tax=Fictibacillus phosphorivorans TaxID=1221500 RepID=UPI00203E1732|nr:histidinol-phosphatase HisJ [Fictibacillus phosphorivorans]MCM3717953.1 histidinol-phosphatase HisJ [Fictibacillus phosphorivorans]MCM3775402.1 histidinol-phosphatase HisJ [Fictibacillus phosphorivorans]
MYYDGHVHTPFCPHGSDDSFEKYIERAIALGIKGLSFTEHAPLPKNFEDPAPAKDSSMQYADLNSYFQKIRDVKKTYEKFITIQTGLEIDFIEGYEWETEQLLREVGPELDDAILSVHFLNIEGKYYCMDYDENVFEEMIKRSGTLASVYKQYFTAVEKSIDYPFINVQPLRIGHITLAKKFQKLFSADFSIEEDIDHILHKISQRGMSLDYNSAGVVKPYCGEPYPPSWIIKEAQKRKIPLVYGSDAHSAKGLGQGFEQIEPYAKLTSPLLLDGAK